MRRNIRESVFVTVVSLYVYPEMRPNSGTTVKPKITFMVDLRAN